MDMKSTAQAINWSLIANLPADGEIYAGGPDYGAFRVCRIPSTRLHVGCLIAETGTGVFRRRLVPRNGKPQAWAVQEQISEWPLHRKAEVAA